MKRASAAKTWMVEGRRPTTAAVIPGSGRTTGKGLGRLKNKSRPSNSDKRARRTSSTVAQDNATAASEAYLRALDIMQGLRPIRNSRFVC
jgi:hypothetical protein